MNFSSTQIPTQLITWVWNIPYVTCLWLLIFGLWVWDIFTLPDSHFAYIFQFDTFHIFSTYVPKLYEYFNLVSTVIHMSKYINI